MTKVAPSRRWTRAAAAIGLALALHATRPARADAPTQWQANVASLPPPAPGTQRLVRLGPQVLLVEDDQGRFTMADEGAAEPKRGQSLRPLMIMLGIVAAGAFVNLRIEDGTAMEAAVHAGSR
jgi:hypothetical protein